MQKAGGEIGNIMWQ